MADTPIDETRAFIDTVISQSEQIPEHLAGPRDQPLIIKITLKLTIDDRIVPDIKKETELLIKSMRK